MRRLLVLIGFAGACAHSRANVTVNANVTAEASEEGEPRHGSKGAHEPIALPHTVVDSSTGAELDEAQLAERLRAARAVYVGEEHPNPHHHAVELEVLERAYAADPSIALGLEMLPRTLQAPLDQFLAGALDEDALLAAVAWKKTWGYDWGFYRPLLLFCREHHLRAWALNATRALSHAVAQRGLDGLTSDEKRQLPELRPGPDAHRDFAREAFGAHPHGKFSAAQFDRFYAAQLVWDETMAERVAAALSAPDAPHHLVVVAGEGHVRRWAIPERAARRGAAPFVTILPALDAERAAALKERAADLLWVLQTGRVELTRSDERDAAVGRLVTLRGVVSNTKIATLLGVDVDSDSPDLRGRPAVATGVLERSTVTQAELDAELERSGQFANRGAGTFYRLIDPSTQRLAHARER